MTPRKSPACTRCGLVAHREASERARRFCGLRCQFLAKVPEGRPPEQCWEWRATRGEWGHGIFSFLLDGKTVTIKATRMMWILTHGADPRPLFILHSCDNPPCVNPAHLRVGTQAENVHEMYERGRANPPCGARSGTARLTEAQVAEARRIVAAGEMSARAVARMMGVTHTAINDAIHGRTWAETVSV